MQTAEEKDLFVFDYLYGFHLHYDRSSRRESGWKIQMKTPNVQIINVHSVQKTTYVYLTKTRKQHLQRNQQSLFSVSSSC